MQKDGLLVVYTLQVFWQGRPSCSWHPLGGHSAIQPGPMHLAWCGMWKSFHSQTTSTRSLTCFVKVGAENNGMRWALAREEIQLFSEIPVTLKIESLWFVKLQEPPRDRNSQSSWVPSLALRLSASDEMCQGIWQNVLGVTVKWQIRSTSFGIALIGRPHGDPLMTLSDALAGPASRTLTTW